MMSDYLFPPPPVPSLAIAGDERRFPVRRIFCVGRNYAAHALEMGGDGRDAPFFFGKPADALVSAEGTRVEVPYPPATQDLHHEVELVVALSRGGAGLAPAEARGCVFGYAVGVDLTRRDLQHAAKAKGRPWDAAKGFDASAPVGALQPVEGAGHPLGGAIWLEVNGEPRQQGDLSQMSWAVPEIIAALSTLWTLKPGDLIFTGTPSGVGALRIGDVLRGGVEGVGELTVRIAPTPLVA